MYANIMRLTKEVQVNTVEKDGVFKTVLNNRVAIADRDKTTFVDITAWGKLAELMGEYLSKGNEFYGEGELRNGTYFIDEREISTVYLRLSAIKFTHGNKRTVKEQEETEN